MQPITDTTTLIETCARLGRHPFVTVDTEFLRESTYYPKLCVLQMASVDESVVVDALAPGIELDPLFELRHQLAEPRESLLRPVRQYVDAVTLIHDALRTPSGEEAPA